MALAQDQNAWDIIDSLFSFSSGQHASGALSGNYTDSAFRMVFYYFNTNIILAAAALYAFILVIGTINTAKDGEFLGKNWSSYWIPLRVILGSVSAIPLKSGFCIAQYFIFVIVGVGISFADHVWSNSYNDITHSSVPPTLSSNINQSLTDDLGVYMLSDYIQTYVQKNNIKNNTLTINETADTESTNILQAAKTIQSYVSASSTSGIDDFFKNDGDISQNVKYMLNGMDKWTYLDGDDYIQYLLDHFIWQYNVIIPDSVDRNISSKAQQVLQGYTKNRKDCDPSVSGYIDVISKGINVSNYLGDASAHPLEVVSSCIVDNVRKQLAGIASDDNKTGSQNTKGSDSQAASGVWWNADQKYFEIDDSFSTTMTNFQSAFDTFNQLFDETNNGLIKLNKTGLQIVYFRQGQPVDTLASNYAKQSLHYTLKPQGSPTNTTKLLDIASLADSGDQYMHLDMTKLKKDFSDILTKANQKQDDVNTTCRAFGDTNTTPFPGLGCQQIVDAVIPDTVSSDIGNYFMVIDALTQKQGMTVEAQQQMVAGFIELLKFLSQNGVSFIKTASDVEDLSDPAENFLDTLFSNMGITNPDKSVLQQLYNLGESSDGGVVTQAFSQIKQIQSVGQSIITMMVESLQSVANKVRDKAKTMMIAVGVEQTTAKAAALVAAAGSFFAPGLPGAISAMGDVAAQITMMKMMYDLSSQLIWLPILFFVLVTLFGIAIMLTLVIPLAPFMLFWAGKMAWLLLIIEALIAAPVVALGLVYPDGRHDMYGESEPAIKIMLNLVLRPVLMVVGMIGGLILTYIVVSFSAHGFHVIATQIGQYYGLFTANATGTKIYTSGVLSIILLFLYASFISMAFYKCFSLIYILPDKVLQWIGGGQNERAGVEELSEMKSTASQHAQGAAQSGTQAVERSNQTQQELAKGVQNVGQSSGAFVNSASEYQKSKKTPGNDADIS
ncbi:DotA/TraY family protein [Facilibium subflavum]|uniref:DotA/TraY family protein n=1 Tax=Facilibium subflavum TaxID=2219058 RepID=UPI000E64A6CC|nr:DotA/TraY family protein [Facilibium subflavum]